jgi:hypothetical protein
MAMDWGHVGTSTLSGAGTGTMIMPGWGTAIGGAGGLALGLLTGGGKKGGKGKSFLQGSPEEHTRTSTLMPEQMGLYNQSINAGMGRGAGGAFGTAADYYRDMLSDNPSDMDAFAAPEMRRYAEDIAPNIAEQYAGMGSGGLNSSGFRNAQNQAGVDLAERLGSIRANLRQNAAQGLTGIGQVGLGNYSKDVMTQPGSEGFLSQIAPALGTSLVSGLGSWFGGKGNKVGANSSPYGTSNPYGTTASPNGWGASNFATSQVMPGR